MVSARDEVSASLVAALWPDMRQPAILGCAGRAGCPPGYGEGRPRAWHTGTTSTTFCRSGSRKRLVLQS